MADDFTVIVLKKSHKKFLQLRYTDPVTGKHHQRSAGTNDRTKAQKLAGEWEAELRAGRSPRGRDLQWDTFREAYQQHVDSTLAETTGSKVFGTFNIVDRVMKPDNVRRVSAQWVTRFQNELLQAGRSPATVESHCRHLKAALNWAQGQGLIQAVPTFNRLKKARTAKLMKGRPITLEEFERMLQAVTDHMKPRQHASLTFLLRGLWLSGLRLGEALSLTWDNWADGIRVDVSGDFVKLLIPSESEKGGQDRVYPVTPDFAELLLSVPEDERTEHVFNPVLHRGIVRRTDTVSKAIATIGQKAKVKVDQKADKAVYASAHDLRRSFGYRWSRKVPSMVLKELMRHNSVTTTEKYYVHIDADNTAAMLAGMMANQPSEGTFEGTPKQN